jgi:hypothetical protein
MRFMALLTSDSSGRVLLWDLNRSDFVRELEAKGAEVRMARINDGNGDVLLARGRNVKITTLNGVELLDQLVCEETDDEVMSVAWVEARKHEWLEKSLFLTGHRIGLVKLWQKVITRTGTWALVLIRNFDASLPAHVSNRRNSDAAIKIPITTLLPVGGVIYAGDDAGRVVSFDDKPAFV